MLSTDHTLSSQVADKDTILEANRADKAVGQQMLDEGKLSQPNFKRLDLEGAKFDGVLQRLKEVAFSSHAARTAACIMHIVIVTAIWGGKPNEKVMALEDPVGKLTLAKRLDDDLDMYRITYPSTIDQ